MKIRHRITIWITITGLLSTLILSLIVFLEMVEEPYELLEQELDTNAQALATMLQVQPDGTLKLKSGGNQFITPYWIKIFDDNKHVQYASGLVQLIDIPLKKTKSAYNVQTDIPFSRLDPESEDANELMSFRVKELDISIDGKHYVIQIARPLENLVEELIDLTVLFGIGIAISSFILIFAGYIVAGRILKPIRKINATSQEINEKTLDKRIPLGRNRDELYELSSSLNSMFDRLQFSFYRQKEFIANASHELKTPLTMLRLSLEEALQNEELPESYHQHLENQNKILLRMNRLIKNLLDLSALELADRCTMEKLSFNDLVASVIEDFQPLANDLNIHCIVHIDDTINLIADKEKIKHLLINLFDNALKYNKHDGEMRLQASVADEILVFELFNTGPGIPFEDRERVFEQFYRVEKSRATALGGVGLGLTIVKRIINLHKGEIAIESKPGEWTIVRVSIPICQ